MTRFALEIAQDIREGKATAVEVLAQTLARIESQDSAINAFTLLTPERAQREALAVDQHQARAETPRPLAGVPYAVKNLFDIAGEVTLAGGKVNAGNPPAGADAVLVQRLAQAGAVLVGALNMDEHAYGFTTENTHYGPCRNPHDPSRIAGGSSGGSAAAVAAGLVPLTLGSDTNGSIRVPASLCGVFGLKPTFGRLPRSGSFPFVASLDHLGPFAANVADLAAAYDALQGPWPEDAACAQRPAAAVSGSLAAPKALRIGVLSGYFHDWAGPEARQAVSLVAQSLGASAQVALVDVAQARAAAFILTAAQAGALHQKNLQSRYGEYEPYSRDRLVAGSLVPAHWVVQAQRARHRFQMQMRAVFENYDVLIAAATPVPAVPIGTEILQLNGHTLPARASMGLLTQPISAIGLPVCTVPVWPQTGPDAHLPIGVQLIAAPWREEDCLAAAHAVAMAGVAHVRRPPLSAPS